MLEIPNVKIIDPSYSSYDIIPTAKIILGITSTVLWESVLLKRPIITFGDVFFNKLPMVKRCRSVEELPQIIKNTLESNTGPDEKTLVNFIGAILEESVEVDLISLWEKEDQGEDIRNQSEGLKRLAELIAKKINLINEQ